MVSEVLECSGFIVIVDVYVGLLGKYIELLIEGDGCDCFFCYLE